jgi:hypothetical protein
MPEGHAGEVQRRHCRAGAARHPPHGTLKSSVNFVAGLLSAPLATDSSMSVSPGRHRFILSRALRTHAAASPASGFGGAVRVFA